MGWKQMTVSHSTQTRNTIADLNRQIDIQKVEILIQRKEIEKWRSEIERIYGYLQSHNSRLEQMQIKIKQFEETERHAILRAEAAEEMAYDQNPTNITLLQTELLEFIGMVPGGVTTKMIGNSKFCPSSRLYKLLVGKNGSFDNVRPDGLLRLEPRLRTEVREEQRGANGRGIIRRRYYWIEPKKQKPVKYPAIKI
jgi:hypothetical protein